MRETPRSYRLRTKISEYIEDKRIVKLGDLIEYLNRKKNMYGTRKIAGNLIALGFRQESRDSDIYLKRY
jgi:predicted house-cleaning noncanonical NTP pyrophosphatase (MazG superfamily)